eukprot:653036-Pleurochrysis_carterae.AAC.2
MYFWCVFTYNDSPVARSANHSSSVAVTIDHLVQARPRMSKEEVPVEPSVGVDINQPIADSARIYDFFHAMGQDLGSVKKIEPCVALAGHLISKHGSTIVGIMKKACTEVKFIKAAKLFSFKEGFKMNVQEKLNFEFKVADEEKKA